MHKYNHQDHSTMIALPAVKNLQGGRFNHWNVNTPAGQAVPPPLGADKS
jgi:hypothetical protein